MKKDGLYFAGWSLNQNSTETIYNGEYYNGSNVTLYAVWLTATEYFDGSSKERAISVTEGTINAPGYVRYYKFVAKYTGKYEIYSSGSDDAYGEIYDQNRMGHMPNLSQ